MKQAAASPRGGHDRKFFASHRLALALGSAFALPLAAQDLALPADAAGEPVRVEVPLRLEVNATQLPRLEPEQAAFNGRRLDLSVLPDSRSGLGVMAGMSSAPSRLGLQGTSAPRAAAVDLGVHWRHTFDDSRQIDITAWRRMTPPPDAYTLIQQQEPLYAARVEMKLASTGKSRLLAATGFIGMQLQSGARISIKRRNGGPMIYYRSSF